MSRQTSARVLVVGCPDWPVVASGGAAGDAAVAVVAGGRVVGCSPAARAAGVRREQRVRDAQRRCPDLEVRDDDPDAQARLFEQVVACVERLCPRVEAVRPGVCAIPARGPARYFGGEPALADLVRTAVAELGFGCRVGVADGLFAAVLAARAGGNGRVVASEETRSFLAGHPVRVLDRPELAGLLIRLGVHTLGELAALPSGDVLARFGADGATAHRLARGLTPRALAPRPPGRDLTVRRVFDPPVEQTEPTVFAAKALADELHATLAELELACVRVEVEVTTEDGRRWSRLWRHDGLLSAPAVAERVRWQLDAWRTATGPDEALTGGVVALRLLPDQLVPDAGRQLALWGQSTPDDRVTRAATRVQTVLGHGAVTRPVEGGGRAPGERVVRIPWGDAGEPPLPVEGSWPGRIPPPLPAVVYPRPVPATLVDAAGAPVTVSGRSVVSAAPAWLTIEPRGRLDVAGVAARRPRGGELLAVTGWTGPWPAVEQWWDPVRSRRLARCQVTTDDGRAFLLLARDGRWYAEAAYA